MHPFAQYIATLGRGKKGTRSLTMEEACNAFEMIMQEQVTPEQLGAFLMLLRVKEESGEEIAGFVTAVRRHLALPDNLPKVDLDWTSYAGKRRHLPWFILAVLALADSGIRIFMHGASGHTEGRLYTREVFKALGLPISLDWDQAGQQLDQYNLTYMDLEQLCPKLHQLIELRPILGLRTPVHTLSRQINPLHADCTMQSIFHPGYQLIHQQAELLLNQPRMAVIKGDGGEVECNPDAPCTVFTVEDGQQGEEQWPAYFERRHVKPAELDISQLGTVWRGESEDEYALGAIRMTLAITLKMMGRASTQAEALEMAETIWNNRNREAFLPAERG